jgi:hypothetical protein
VTVFKYVMTHASVRRDAILTTVTMQHHKAYQSDICVLTLILYVASLQAYIRTVVLASQRYRLRHTIVVTVFNYVVTLH